MAKKINLKIVKADHSGQEFTIDYKETIRLIVASASDGKGFSVEDVRQSVKILNRVEAAGNEVVFEDAEYQYLLTRLRDFRFSFAHKALVEFIDNLESAEDVEIGA